MPAARDHNILEFQIVVEEVVTVHVVHAERDLCKKNFSFTYWEAFCTTLSNTRQVEIQIAA